MKLSNKEIKHIAGLARINLTNAEIKQYQRDLSDILTYFETLNKLDTEKIPEIEHITGVSNVIRQDIPKKSEREVSDLVLKNAPKIEDKQFKVKAVL